MRQGEFSSSTPTSILIVRHKFRGHIRTNALVARQNFQFLNQLSKYEVLTWFFAGPTLCLPSRRCRAQNKCSGIFSFITTPPTRSFYSRLVYKSLPAFNSKKSHWSPFQKNLRSVAGKKILQNKSRQRQKNSDPQNKFAPRHLD